MSEEEKKVIEWLKNKPEECTNIINASSYIENKKAYAKERTNFKILLNLITKLQKENEEKDKQIDLMAEYISKIDIEEDICINNKTNPDWCNEDYKNCKNCIKQYFEK